VYTTEEQHSAVRFLWANGLNAKDIRKQLFPVCRRKYLSRKVFHNWVDKFSQGLSRVPDNSRSGRPIAIVTEATVQRGEELIRAGRRITIKSVATGCSHGLAHSIIHDHLKFRKVCSWWLHRELKDREKINRMGLSLQHFLRYADEREDMLNSVVTGDES
jgi:hypothetical protein